MKKTLLLIITFFLMTSGSYAGTRGTTGADFLKIGLGAGATGVGEAYTARFGDPMVVFYNPAGLAEMPISQLSATHLNWIAETQYEAISFARPLLGVGTVGVSAFTLHMPEIPGLDGSGNDTGMLAAYDLGIQFSYARNVSSLIGIQGLSTGANLKILNRQLAGLSASGIAADIGFIYEPLEKWTIGLSVLNLGYLSGFESGNEVLPIVMRLGTQYNYLLASDHQLIGGFDLVQSSDSTFKTNIGLEYMFAETVYLRAGYKVGYDTDGLQGGAGIKWNQISVDYAIKSMGVFGMTHFVTASVGFGQSMQKAQSDKVKEMLNEAEALYTSSNYEASLKIVEEAVLVDPKNKHVLELKLKLDTVIKMLQMPAMPEDELDDKPPVSSDGHELTPDELEELGKPNKEEVTQ